MGLLVLKKGVEGHAKEVRALQALLNHRLIPSPNLPVTGHFGDLTHEAVVAFQKMKGLKPDGIVGPHTWTALGQPLPTSGNAAVGLPNEIVITGAEKISPKAQRVLKEILQVAGLRSATISSVARNPYNQARVMYDNLVGTGKGQGVDAQRHLYAAAGNQVIDVYVANKAKSREEVIKLMQAKIEQIGPEKVSHHALASGFETFDVAPASIKNGPDFVKALKVHKEVARYILPPHDPGYHIEIKKEAAP
jgi:hypothetical protein